ELAKDFFDPYDDAINKIYDALITAQTVGVDLSQVYMMLNDSCNQWGQYMCNKPNEKGAIWEIQYPENSRPYVGKDCGMKTESNGETTIECKAKKECTLLKLLTNDDEVYEGWIEPEETSGNNKVTVVACASGALNSAKIFARRTKNKNGAGLVDIDALELWMDQIEPNKVYDENKEMAPYEYCSLKDSNREAMKSRLQAAVLSRNVLGKNNDTKLCQNRNDEGKWTGSAFNPSDTQDCAYINPLYAICNTHFFNAGYADVETAKTKDAEKEAVSADFTSETKEIIGLKITAISQQMYKQYEYIKATLRRIQIQLEKAVLSANLEAAGAESEDGGSSSSGGLARGSSKNSQYQSCNGKGMQDMLYCLRQNYSNMVDVVDKKCDSKTKTQMEKDANILNGYLSGEDYKVTGLDTKCVLTSLKSVKDCQTCLEQINIGLNKFDEYILDREARRQGRYRD
ncbi:MAG: hypothetical protein J6W08_01165, partial [Alphaproteobacteria bacterium]|nr:hypothetical protein [Alphaproteobacteria bacterium]